MASRFDRLVLLLNTGSTAAVRSTAAQQLGEIQKQHPGELNNLLSRVLVHLRSKQWETRIAAGQAIYAIASNVPQWDPASTVKSEDGEQESKETDGQGWLSFENFDIGNVLEHGKTLLGSAGKEYDVEWGSMTPEERLALQKKNLRQRLGIGSQFMEDDLLDDSDLSGIALSNTKTTSPVVKEKSPSPIHDSKESLEISEGLSARERNRLKRKAKKDAKDKGKDKVRVMDLSHRRKTDPSSVPTAVKVEEESKPIDGKGFSVTEQPCSDRVVIESILPSSNAEADVEWPFEAICEVLCMDLFDPAWEVRHGAGIGLREVIKVHGAGAGKIVGITENANEARHNDWLADCAVRLLCVFALDRFGDFVSDQVIAPVRETCAQTIGALLQYMPPNLVLQTQRVLLRLIMQTDTQLPDSKRVVGDIWEVRHAGMLGLKYAVAVRKDLVEQMLEGTVDAVVLGLKDNDDDVRAVSASTLLPITDSFVNHLPDRIPAIVSVLWDCLKDLKDDLTSSTASVMDLLAKLFSSTAVLRYMHKAAKDDESHSLECLMPRLYPFFRHTITSVRVAVLNTLYTFIEMDLGEGQADAGWIDEACLRLVYQNMIVEEKQDIVNLSLKVWTSICKRLEVTRERISAMATPQLQHWFTILMTPLGTPLDTRLFYSATAVSDSVNGGRNRKAQQGQTRHNLDAGMISQDFALVSPEAVLRGRVAAATALGRMMSVWQSETQEPVFKERLEKCLGSPCALNRQLIGVLLEEWAVSARSRDPNMVELAECNSLASDLCSICCTILESDGPTVFSELNAILGRIRIECQGLLNCFVAEGGVPAETIPSLPPTIGEENVGKVRFRESDHTVITRRFERVPSNTLTFASLGTISRDW